MKHQVKKTLAGLAAIAMLMSGASVFAEDPASQIDTGTDNYWAQTFNGMGSYAAPEAMRICSDISFSASNTVSSTLMDADAIAGLEAEGIYLGGKTGLFGKADTAFGVENATKPLFLEVKSGDKNNPNMGEPSGLNPRTSSNGEFGNTSNYATFSFEMAVTDYSADRTFQMQTAKNGSGSDGVTMPTAIMMAVAKDTGLVSVFNKSTEYKMPLNKWVRFDVVTYQVKSGKPTNPYAYVYADGALIADNIGFDALKNDDNSSSGKLFKSVQGLHFGFAAGETGCYVDNLVARRILGANVTGGASFAENAKLVVKELTLASDAATIDNAAKTITVPAGTAAGAITGADVVFVTADGTVQATAQENGYAIASGDMITDDEKTEGTIYYTLTVEGGAVEPEPEEDVALTVTADSGFYAEAADASEKNGVVGFQTRVEKAGEEQVAKYGTFLLKSEDFETAAGSQTEVANQGDIASGNSFVVEVRNIGADAFATPIYAKSFVETAAGNFFYSAITNTTVDAGNKWLGTE